MQEFILLKCLESVLLLVTRPNNLTKDLIKLFRCCLEKKKIYSKIFKLNNKDGHYKILHKA